MYDLLLRSQGRTKDLKRLKIKIIKEGRKES